MAPSSTGFDVWEKDDFMPRPDDLLQERLYCIQWMRPETWDKAI